MTVDEIFQQADNDMKEQWKAFEVNEQPQKRKKSFILKNLKRFLITVVVALIIIFSIAIYFGIQYYKQVKAEIILQIETYRFEYEHLDESNMTNAEVFAKKMFTFFTTEELQDISKSLSLEEIGNLLSFSSIEHIDAVPEYKRDSYKKVCFFLQYINDNNCGDQPFTEELNQKYFGE